MATADRSTSLATAAVIGLLTLLIAAHMSSPCTAAQLSGTFKAVPNSEGAGNLVYALRLRNTSTKHCFVTGIPGLKLLNRDGKALPTHVTPAHPGALTAVMVDLAPGKTATATARFSPDVAGTGDHMMGACEPKAYWLRVTPNGGGTLRASIQPPTSVCERGGMTWSVLTGP
jgi:hypothetical protein